MSIEHIFETTDPSDWINTLEPYQKDPIVEMGLTTENADSIAQKWLSATTSYTAGFGTSQGARPFFDNIKKEVLKFICDESAYVEDKKRLQEIPGVNKTAIVAVVSTAIATVVGTSAIYLIPVIVIVLFSFGRIVKNAFCKTYYSP